MSTPKLKPNRRYWIEVSNGRWTWGDDDTGGAGECERCLKAPSTMQYHRMLKPIRPGDLVLTYYSSKMIADRARASSIVGISLVDSSYRQEGEILIIDTVEPEEFVKPIRFSEMKNLEGLSTFFKQAIRINFQRYLIEILESDFIALLDVHQENRPIGQKYLGPKTIDDT